MPASKTPLQPAAPKPHPIDALIATGNQNFDNLLSKEIHNLTAAAKQYRRSRGRHPPPGFDAWVRFAQESGSIIVEEFFDQIYHDIAPFWGLPAYIIRLEARSYEMTIQIRNHNATAGSEWFWTQIWLDMIKTIEHLLPDMDIPVNAMDEPRLSVPWEDIELHMKLEQASRWLSEPNSTTTIFSSLLPPGKSDTTVEPREKDWQSTGPYWKVAARGCHPDSLARKSVTITNFDHAPQLSMNLALPHTLHGFVSNYTLSSDFCHQPDLQALHGALIEPLTISSTKLLTPMFGGSKLATNNEILLPAPMYWANEERFSGGKDHGGRWSGKADKVIWRGTATGGRHRANNWKGFQRHRFLAMVNSTQASQAENRQHHPENWILPPKEYDVTAVEQGRFGNWTREWSDAAFVNLICDQYSGAENPCDYLDPFFEVKEGQKMSQQFKNKVMPDIDGNSFSGRYRSFLLSTSLPVKATIFREWHDSRLIAWKHFVPMDNRFLDFWGIVEYFLGDKRAGIKGHDIEAQRIATEGKTWAEKVLRREDMQTYVLRLLLEYARVSDDGRENMGYVDDML